ncbi:phosphatase PAP2 family protein [Nocardia sp. X0981]
MSTAPGAPEPFAADRAAGRTRLPNGTRTGEEGASAAPGPAPATAAAATGPHRDAPASGSLVVAASTAAVTAAIPLSFPPGGGPTPFDLDMSRRVDPWLGPRPWVAEVLALATDTGVVLALLCGGAAWFAWQRRWWAAATAILVPEIAVAINTWALKPWWGRSLHDYLAYPSGHTVHLVSVMATLVLLIRSVRARLVLIALTVPGWCAGAVGMIALDFHLATDVVGGATAGIALAIGLYRLSVCTARALGVRPADRPDPGRC